ncbi:MAG: hypothetical protein QM640_02785 [Niabella sp.]
MKKGNFLIVLLCIYSAKTFGQQVSDTLFSPGISNAAYSLNMGPVVAIDEGHNNFHTQSGRYVTLSKLLKQDGYVVQKFEGSLEKNKLKDIDILIIANSLNSSNVNNWALPVPSAFSDAEIKTLNTWVKKGGRLLLIADHMPFPGAAQKLGASFGIDFQNVFASDKRRRELDYFTRSDGSLVNSQLTEGLDSIVTFGGSAFSITGSTFTPILVLDHNYALIYQDTARVFNKNTVIKPAAGWLQLACFSYGKGRIVVSGEAAMFSAQVVVQRNNWKMGFNNPGARNNVPLIQNLFRWLGDGIKSTSSGLSSSFKKYN